MLSNISNGEMLTETMKYHSTSNRMVKVQNTGITEILVRMWNSEVFPSLWWKYKMVQPLWSSTVFTLKF